MKSKNIRLRNEKVTDYRTVGELTESRSSKMKIMIFAEGTKLKPKSLLFLYNHRASISFY